MYLVPKVTYNWAESEVDMLEYPDYLYYASDAEIKEQLQKIKQRKQHQLLSRCDGLETIEHNGKLRAVVDIEVYQQLVHFLHDHTK